MNGKCYWYLEDGRCALDGKPCPMHGEDPIGGAGVEYYPCEQPEDEHEA